MVALTAFYVLAFASSAIADDICGAVGYHDPNKISYYMGNFFYKGPTTFALCASYCKKDEPTCKAFRYSYFSDAAAQYCEFFDNGLDGNFTDDSSQPYYYYDIGCGFPPFAETSTVTLLTGDVTTETMTATPFGTPSTQTVTQTQTQTQTSLSIRTITQTSTSVREQPAITSTKITTVVQQRNITSTQTRTQVQISYRTQSVTATRTITSVSKTTTSSVQRIASTTVTKTMTSTRSTTKPLTTITVTRNISVCTPSKVPTTKTATVTRTITTKG